jgi:hypothetical protein
MPELSKRIDALDVELFSHVEAALTVWDKRALLALHSATAASRDQFAYLEIGSYRGGSLQVLVRDPRCRRVSSIDARTGETRDDARRTVTYEGNTTDRMLRLLARVPDADVGKLVTFDASTEGVAPSQLPDRSDLCFIDGEHSQEAVLRDARFCAESLEGRGVIAFHDFQLVQRGIRAFLKENWADVTHAVAFTGQVFAVELGGTGVLRAPVIDRAIASRWHSIVWRTASRPPTPALHVAALSVVPRLDSALFALRRRVKR